jgi:hypothetical protein
MFLYKVPWIISLCFLSLMTFGLEYLQRDYYCSSSDCVFWGGLPGYMIINVMLGWVVCLYVWSLTTKTHLSTLMKIMMLPVFLSYFFVLYYLFGNYSMIVDNQNITYQESSFSEPESHSLEGLESIYFIRYSNADTFDDLEYYAYFKNGETIYIAEQPAIYLAKKNGITMYETKKP